MEAFVYCFVYYGSAYKCLVLLRYLDTPSHPRDERPFLTRAVLQPTVKGRTCARRDARRAR
eukprot:5286821-Pyramimonas_sp.AAC.1